MIEFKSFKYRIYPNKAQRIIIDQHLQASRFVKNYFICLNEQRLLDNNQYLSCDEMKNELVSLIEHNPFLEFIDKTSFNYVLKNVEKLFYLYSKGLRGIPKERTYKNREYSYKVKNVYNNIRIKNKIDIPKVRSIKYRGTLKLTGTIINATISVTSSNKYFISLTTKYPKLKTFRKTGKSIGIDAGHMNLVTLSNGKTYENKREYSKIIGRISFETKNLEKMQYGSKRFEKKRLKIAKLHGKIANRRKDNINKITTEIVKDFDNIYVESLKTNEMIKDSKRPERIYDAAWYETQRLLSYKSDCYEKNFKKISPFYPSSQICSNCGYINKKLKDINIKIWKCPSCNAVHDRDINAAINILKEGSR